MVLTDKWKVILYLAMRSYFKSYKKRFPGKPLEDAVNATRNYAEGYIAKMLQLEIDRETSLWIEETLNRILLEDL